jgi:hypothetical protein
VFPYFLRRFLSSPGTREIRYPIKTKPNGTPTIIANNSIVPGSVKRPPAYAIKAGAVLVGRKLVTGNPPAITAKVILPVNDIVPSCILPTGQYPSKHGSVSVISISSPELKDHDPAAVTVCVPVILKLCEFIVVPFITRFRLEPPYAP